jgi:hypothetical protein
MFLTRMLYSIYAVFSNFYTLNFLSKPYTLSHYL